MGKVIVLMVMLALTGCATQSHDVPVFGQPTGDPTGWTDYCKRHPADIDCR